MTQQFDEPGSGPRKYLWPVVFGLIVVGVFATRFDDGRSTEALIIAAGIPLFAAWKAVSPLRDVSTPLKLAGIAVALIAAVTSETEVVHLFDPPPALAEIVLTPKEPDATFSLPDGTHDVEIETRGKIAGANAEGEYGATLHRGDRVAVLAGTFSGNVSSGRRSRLPVVSGRGPSEHADRVLVDLTGSGPVHAHLDRIEGSLAQSLHVAVLPPPPGGHKLRFVFVVLAIAALVLDALAGLYGVRASLAAWIGFAGVAAVYLPMHFVPDDALTSVIGAIFAAVIVGWVVGWLLGYASSRVASRFA